jgi:hypothetical protein
LHFKSDRLIHISCDKATQARQREPEETVKLLETRVKDRETAQKEIEAEHLAREQHKEQREKFKEQVFKLDIEAHRAQYKEQMTALM